MPTVDTVRYEYLVSKMLQDGYPVLLVGNVGTGKTSTAVSVMEACDNTKYTVLSINISAQVCLLSTHNYDLFPSTFFEDYGGWFARIH